MRAIAALFLTALSVTCASAQAKPGQWQSMFDGKQLDQWKETPFTGHGSIRVDGGVIVLEAGKPMTGITWMGPFPHAGYEIRFEGARRKGGDFFASLTFPVGDSFCTWVTGGWGGDIVGLSSIDGWDASDNETRTYFTFETGRWYSFLLAVTPGRIAASIDGKQIFSLDINGRAIGLRHGDIKLSTPLGFASYNTDGALRKIEYRVVQP